MDGNYEWPIIIPVKTVNGFGETITNCAALYLTSEDIYAFPPLLLI